MPDELLSNLKDLHEAIEHVLFAIALDDPDGLAAAQANSLQLIESLAVLHCDIVGKVIRDRRALDRKMGLRQISIPINFSGEWLVLPESARPAL